MISTCGIVCTDCEFYKSKGCTGCHTIQNPFWGACPIKACAKERAIQSCGECNAFPCELLEQFSYDKEQGDNGARIKVLEKQLAKNTFEKLQKHALKKLGAIEDFKEEWDAKRFLLMDKMFLMVGENKENRPIVTMKLAPEKGEFFRTTYPNHVVAGYYMNKTHWNSLYLDRFFSDSLLYEMIDESYQLIFKSFSKKKQTEIRSLT